MHGKAGVTPLKHSRVAADSEVHAGQLPCGEVLVGDCVELMAALPAKSVDLIFADPPYNLQLKHELYRPDSSRVDAVAAKWDKFGSFSEYDEFTSNWLTSARRVLKDTGTLWVIGSYHNIYRVGTILQNLGFWILNDVIWLKSNPMPNFRGVRFTNAHETLIWAQKQQGAKYTFNYHALKSLNDDLQMRSDWKLPLATGDERLRTNGSKAHPTQKPEALLYRILMASTQPADVVLDPFFGTGTTGAVAAKLGRQWIGMESSAAYARLARRRIQRVPPTDRYALEVERDSPARLPFGTLLEYGLLAPGQRLYFKNRRAEARVLADGRLLRGRISDSIHGMARRLSKGAPANGWELWYYEDRHGNRLPINNLRVRLQESFAALQNPRTNGPHSKRSRER